VGAFRNIMPPGKPSVLEDVTQKQGRGLSHTAARA